MTGPDIQNTPASPAASALGERQVGRSLSDIRADHVGRYEWAAAYCTPSSRVLDAGCGVGYGTHLLAARAQSVVGVDADAGTVAFARANWAVPNAVYLEDDVHFLKALEGEVFDLVVAFEVVEHLVFPERFLRSVRARLNPGGRLLLSVPNEAAVPHSVELNPFHVRHFDEAALRGLAYAAGFAVEEVVLQGIETIGDGDRTILAACSVRADAGPEMGDAEEFRRALARADREIQARAAGMKALQKEVRRLHRRDEAARLENETLNRAMRTLEEERRKAATRAEALERANRVVVERMREAHALIGTERTGGSGEAMPSLGNLVRTLRRRRLFLPYLRAALRNTLRSRLYHGR